MEFFYKFMSAGRVDGVVGGSLFLKSLRYFRLLELVTADSVIGDRQEATATTLVKRFDGADEQLRKLLEQKRAISVPAGAKGILVENVTVVETTECYVYCFSHGDLASLRAIQSVYDSGVQIADGRALAQRIYDVGSWNGRLVRDHFVVSCGPVGYDQKEHAYDVDGFASADPFKKRAMYADQSEYRICLQPLVPSDDDHLVISIGAVSDLLTPMGKWESPGGSWPAVAGLPESRQDAAAQLGRAIREDEHGYVTFEERFLPESHPKIIAWRRQMVLAYWKLREDTPSRELDAFLLLNGPTRLLPHRLETYAAKYLSQPR